MINYPIPSKDDRLLYHFTSAESLMKIIENMTLKMSSFENLNDLNEKEVNFSIKDGMKYFAIKKYIIQHCSLLSFSRNFKNEGQFPQYGFNHPRMWAQYANTNQGACIVINEDRLLNENNPILSDVCYDIDNVSYFPFINTEDLNNELKPDVFLRKFYKQFFFIKNNDWKQEDERRLFCFDGPPYLSIKNCIEGVCLGSNFTDNDYDLLIKLLKKTIIREQIIISPNIFYLQVNLNGKSLHIPNARIIEELNN